MWPAVLRDRRSKGLFSSPYLRAFRPLASKLLQTRRWRVVERGWIERASLTSRLERMTRGLACQQHQLRQILLLEYWVRNRESGHSAISHSVTP